VAFVRIERKQLGVRGSGGAKVTEGRQVTFIDLETGKERQTLSIPNMEIAPAEHLSFDRYLIAMAEGKRLIEFVDGEYSVGVKSSADHLLPVSSWQRRILRCYMNELFEEAGSKLAKDIENIIKGFL
jgi:hypothetical protein